MNRRYTVVIEKGASSYGAYVPDLPGCVAAARTKASVLKLIREAIELHMADLRETGATIPRASASAIPVDVTV